MKKNDKMNPVPGGTTPFFAIIILACSVLVYTKIPKAAIVLFVCAVLILVEKLIWKISRLRTIKEYIGETSADNNERNNEAIFKAMSPIAGIRVDGTIAWYNSSFKDLFPSLADKKINELVPEINIRALYDNNGETPILAKIGEDFYNILSSVKRKVNADHAAVLLYMEKVTELVETRKTIEMNGFAVAEITIDNYDEAIEDVADEDRLDVILMLEKGIIGWAQDSGGLIKKIEKDKYFAVFTKKQINEFETGKFEILQRVKTFSSGCKIQPTVSIGIGLGLPSLHLNDISAKKALEMALGRGGDQAVIMEDDKFRYYGGNSKETEKRTKVKARTMAHNLRELINVSDNVIIMGHKGSDSDSIGAAIGIASIAAFVKKDAKIIVSTRDEMVNNLLKKIEENHYHDGLFIGKGAVRDYIMPKTLLVICDTHIPEFTEMPELIDIIKNKVVIDHHRRSESFISNADLVFHEPFASSACEMVAELMQYFDPSFSVSTIDAEALYAGIALDTKNFMFKTGVRTFEAAAYLRAAGVDTLKVKKLFRESIDDYKMKACIVTEAQTYGDNIAISLFSGVVSKPVVAAAADELLEITDIKAAFVVARSDDGTISISGRSLGEINVQVILEKLGGGGHLMQAGAQLIGMSVNDAGDLLKEAIDDSLEMA